MIGSIFVIGAGVIGGARIIKDHFEKKGLKEELNKEKMRADEFEKRYDVCKRENEILLKKHDEIVDKIEILQERLEDLKYIYDVLIANIGDYTEKDLQDVDDSLFCDTMSLEFLVEALKDIKKDLS